jgi:uncharacterized membrane protein (DUF485 family)
VQCSFSWLFESYILGIYIASILRKSYAREYLHHLPVSNHMCQRGIP